MRKFLLALAFLPLPAFAQSGFTYAVTNQIALSASAGGVWYDPGLLTPPIDHLWGVSAEYSFDQGFYIRGAYNGHSDAGNFYSLNAGYRF